MKLRRHGFNMKAKTDTKWTQRTQRIVFEYSWCSS
jgi:hypothetical protein